MKKVLGIIIVMVMLILVALSGCIQDPPSFVVMSEQKREEMEGLDKVGYVDLVVKNIGGDGSKTIYVKVTQGTNYWIKEYPLFLAESESEDLSFRFPEIAFWTLDSWNVEVNIS